MAVSKMHMSELKERLMSHEKTVPNLAMVSSADLAAPGGAGGGRDLADPPQGDQSESGQSKC